MNSNEGFDLTRTRIERGKESKGRGVGKPLENHGGLRSLKVFESCPIPLLLRTPEFINSWSDWIEHRIEYGNANRCRATIRVFRTTLLQCEQWGVERSTAAIRHSIMLGYRGLFEPRKFEPRNGHQPEPGFKIDCLGRRVRTDG